MNWALDTAFVRHIRFTLSFPFPDEKSRAEIWQRVFPPTTPRSNLDIQRLARLNIAGGSFYNIALYASFLVADEQVPVNMNHLKRAVQVEYAKLERALTGQDGNIEVPQPPPNDTQFQKWKETLGIPEEILRMVVARISYFNERLKPPALLEDEAGKVLLEQIYEIESRTKSPVSRRVAAIGGSWER